MVLKSKFVVANDKDFDEYVDYIDRDATKVKQHIRYEHDPDSQNEFEVFHFFMDYMEDEKKGGELFTSEKNYLTQSDKKTLKEGFKRAQKNGSPLWQDVISFDNEWLEEQGLYDPTTHSVDEDKMIDVTRKAMEEVLKQEGINPNTVLWSGSIHYNTDNIHVHTAMVQPQPTVNKKRFKNKEGEWIEQFKGQRKQKSLDRMKSKVANEIYNRNKDYERIDNLIRNPVAEKRNVKLSAYEKTRELFLEAIPLLPDDLRQWKYGYHSVDEARPYIDEISRIYLKEFHSDEMNKLYKELDKQVDISERLFGSGSGYDRYKDNKLGDLRKRMGNAVLSEMREYHKQNQFNKGYEYYRKNYYSPDTSRRYKAKLYVRTHYDRPMNYYNPQRASTEFHYSLLRLNRVMRKSFHEYQRDRNIDEFDRMLEGYEY